MHSGFRFQNLQALEKKQFFDPKSYPFHIDNPECIVQVPYFVGFPLFCTIFGF